VFSLYNSQGFALTTNLTHRETHSSGLTSGSPPRSYGAVPPEHGAPSDGPSHSLPLHAPPPEPISHDRDELLHKQRQTLINCIYLAILLIQAVVIICGSDALAKFIDLDSASNRASKERFALIAERDKLRRDIKWWEKVKEDRVPQDAFWDGVWPALDCSAYGKREYWGVLRNIPDDWSPIEACMSMPVEIMGVTIRRPHRCAFIDGSPHIHGYWMVDWDQPDCQPWYREYQDVVGPNRSSFAHAFALTHLHRDARATCPANAELKLSLWA
jgi:hypothetical protein